MVQSANPQIEMEALEDRIRAVTPAALLISSRILRRVIKHDRKLTLIGLSVPHRKSYVIGRDALVQIAEPAELGLRDGQELPETLILLGRPSPERLARLQPAAVLTRYWRLLFHARVHVALEQRFAEHRLTDARLRDRIHCIGQTEFEEIRTVLRQEDLLLPPRDDRTVYIEFAALYLELRYFARSLLARYFPAVQQFDCIDRLLDEDLDADALFAATRPEGAPDPVPAPDRATDGGDGGTEPEPVRGTLPPSKAAYRKLLESSAAVAAVGNDVKAAILKARAARVAPPGLQAEAVAGAAAALDRLAFRLRAALDLDAEQAESWRQVLPVLLDRAALGWWPLEQRLLYDVQKICLDQERPIYALDLVEWAASLGWRPIKRLLPGQQDILTLKHLRSALGRLPGARLPAESRERLAELLHDAVHHSESKVRDRFRPLIGATLQDVGLRPQNLPERVALAKLTEELLDRIGGRGFLTMGDLRDALSRNNLKLPDLAGPNEFVLGDRLIRANRGLAVALDGVYHRGEVYLRWLQRLSSLAFGNPVGRFLTRYVILPFGGAFVLLEGLQHVVGPISKLLVGPSRAVAPVEAPVIAGDEGGVLASWDGYSPVVPEVHGATHAPVHLVHWYSLLLLGLFLLAVLHVPPFRRALAWGLVGLFRGLRTLFVEWPAAVLAMPAVRAVLDSRPVLFLRQHILKPLLVAAPVAGLLRLRAATAPALTVGGLVYLVTAVLLNTRAGRNLEEAVVDRLARAWHQVSSDIVPGLVRWVLLLFKRLLENVELVLYTVDEWLRFRAGDSRLSVAAKTVLGLGWFVCTYLIRVGINLFVEPTFNPIKHFPVVTVAAKLIVPIIPALGTLIISSLEPVVGRAVAGMAAAVAIFFIPGLAGFIVWELSENWRLYQANRPATLRPVVIGHHGETMARLLRPGFHSGTIPKLYAKIRRAQRRAQRTGRWKTFRKQRDALEHVEEAIRSFVERELVVLLEGSKSWGPLQLSVGAVALGSNRVRVELRCPARGPAGAWITFEELSGWLVAGVAESGWLASLTDEQAQAFTVALTGLFKMGGVALVREQVEASLGRYANSYSLTEDGLVIWPGDGTGCEALYPLGEGPRIEPRTSACLPTELPVLDADRVLFRNVPVTWQHWVEGWERDQAGKGPPPPVVEGVRLPR